MVTTSTGCSVSSQAEKVTWRARGTRLSLIKHPLATCNCWGFLDFQSLLNTRRSVFLKYRQKKNTRTQCCEAGESPEACIFDEENCVCICFSLASALRDLVLKCIWYTYCELSRKKMLQWWNVHLVIALLINQWSSKNSLPMPKVDDRVSSWFLPSPRAEFSSEDWHDQSCTHYNTISISPFLALHIFPRQLLSDAFWSKALALVEEALQTSGCRPLNQHMQSRCMKLRSSLNDHYVTLQILPQPPWRQWRKISLVKQRSNKQENRETKQAWSNASIKYFSTTKKNLFRAHCHLDELSKVSQGFSRLKCHGIIEFLPSAALIPMVSAKSPSGMPANMGAYKNPSVISWHCHNFVAFRGISIFQLLYIWWRLSTSCTCFQTTHLTLCALSIYIHLIVWFIHNMTIFASQCLCWRDGTVGFLRDKIPDLPFLHWKFFLVAPVE